MSFLTRLLLTVICLSTYVFGQVPDGAVAVPLELKKALKSSTAKPGDTIQFKVMEDVRDAAGRVRIPRGAEVSGHVVAANARSKDGPEKSKISFLVESVHTREATVAVDLASLACCVGIGGSGYFTGDPSHPTDRDNPADASQSANQEKRLSQQQLGRQVPSQSGVPQEPKLFKDPVFPATGRPVSGGSVVQLRQAAPLSREPLTLAVATDDLVLQKGFRLLVLLVVRQSEPEKHSP